MILRHNHHRHIETHTRAKAMKFDVKFATLLLLLLATAQLAPGADVSSPWDDDSATAAALTGLRLNGSMSARIRAGRLRDDLGRFLDSIHAIPEAVGAGSKRRLTGFELFDE